jgi:divalent metal cation (Fe/Co/Zn/Cd) transporter
MDRALEPSQLREIQEVLGHFERDGIAFHVLRTRQAGQRAFISTHVLVPGDWSVQRGHDVVEDVEAALHERLPYATVFTHLEPADDPRSFADATLDRRDQRLASP